MCVTDIDHDDVLKSRDSQVYVCVGLCVSARVQTHSHTHLRQTLSLFHLRTRVTVPHCSGEHALSLPLSLSLTHTRTHRQEPVACLQAQNTHTHAVRECVFFFA